MSSAQNTTNDREFCLTRGDNDNKTAIRTGHRSLFVLSKKILIVDLEIDPNKEESADDIYTLFSTDDLRSYIESKTIKDDQILGDDSLTLVFTDILSDLSYSLEVDSGKQGEPYYIFEDISYERLKNKQFTSGEEDLSAVETNAVEKVEFDLDNDFEPDYSSVEYEIMVEHEEEAGDDYVEGGETDELDDEEGVPE